jgi:hypothetical protein
VRLSKPIKVIDNIKDKAYYEICPLSVNYESVMFYSTGASVIKPIFSVICWFSYQARVFVRLGWKVCQGQTL